MSFAETSPVSAVMPSYNAEGTIERAIMSVAGQLEPPEELIVVDDASTDDTLAVLYELRKRFPPEWLKVVILKHNAGPSIARNTGWDFASQPYVAFLDADDAWHEAKLSIQTRWMQAYPYIAFSGHWQPHVRPGEKMFLPESWGVQQVLPWQQLVSNHFTTSSVMVHRGVPQRFEEGKHYLEDHQLWLEIMLAGYHAALIELPLAAMFKPAIGASGLSSNLWRMTQGEWDMYARLHRKRLLSAPGLSVCRGIAMLKTALRWPRAKLLAHAPTI